MGVRVGEASEKVTGLLGLRTLDPSAVASAKGAVMEAITESGQP
jgi:hypothetical protein